MRKHVITLVVTVVLILGTFFVTILGSDRPVLGLDLQGGISVVLFPVKGSDLTTLDTAVSIIRNRVDGLGISEAEVNRQGDTVVIDLPGVKDRQKAEDLVGETAELRYRPVLGGPIPYSATASSSTSTTQNASGSTTTTRKGTTSTTKPPAKTTTTAHAAARTITTQPIAARSVAAATPTTTKASATTTKPGSTTTTTKPATADCAKLITPRDKDVASAQVVLPDPKHTVCYLLGPTVLTGKNVKHADARFDSTNGWEVNITYGNDDFVKKVAQPYVNKEVAIALDGLVQSAPKINPGITGRQVQITGNFSEGEARNLALVLRYGSLPIQFDRNQQTVQSVSPTLGKDQLRAGIFAGLLGLALVALYMILFYRLLGVVVWIGLALTGMLMFTIVTFLSHHSFMGIHNLTLTLAGVTGIIVSVGVTVDSYVVYFERLKDEVRTGKTVRSSVETGFRRAFRTIVAADLVSLIGAVVLYVLATGSVKGFAFFLALSTVIDLLLARLFMYPLVVVLARRPALVRLPGVGIAAGLDVAGARA